MDQLKLSEEMLENHFHEIEPHNTKEYAVQYNLDSRGNSSQFSLDSKRPSAVGRKVYFQNQLTDLNFLSPQE